MHIGWFHRYPARFSPDVVLGMLRRVRKLLKSRGVESPVILDAFAGTGATLSAARRMGLRSIGVELTQLGVHITQVRLDPPEDLMGAIKLAEKWAKLKGNRHRLEVPVDLVRWLGVSNAAVLSEWLRHSREIDDIRLRLWLQLAISSSLRPSSRWLSGSIKPQVDPDRTPPPIGANLVRAARLLARDCEAERSAHGAEASLVLKADACQLPLADSSFDAVVTSPPYATMYDYFDVQRLSYLAFGWPRELDRQVGRSSAIPQDGVGFVAPPSLKRWYAREYRGEQTIDGRAVRDYVTRMRAHLTETKRVLRPGGVIAYAVANSRRAEGRFQLVEAVMEIAREIGFKHVRALKRENSTRRILPTARDCATGRFASGTSVAVEEQIIFASVPSEKRPSIGVMNPAPFFGCCAIRTRNEIS